MSTLTDEELEAWSRAAAAAGDGATMLIAEIALGNDPCNGLSPEEIEEEWPSLTDSSSGAELAAMTPEQARVAATKWGSPWTDGYAS